jgi:exopolysaccharide production protein ExoY
MTCYDFTKRAMDIAGSIFGILLFSPLLLGAALWIKIVSPNGPIFADIPDRVGKDRKPFRFLKFRSMIPNAHDMLLTNPKYAELKERYIKNNYKLEPHEDPRLIPGAIFMRKYSIDELPQFFNVLRGDMSIVGPRAYYFDEIEEQSKKFTETQELLPIVLSVKPGVTGTWQVSGRSTIGFEGRIKLDATYAKRRSILYDLLVILKTPMVVLSSKGAY